MRKQFVVFVLLFSLLIVCFVPKDSQFQIWRTYKQSLPLTPKELSISKPSTRNTTTTTLMRLTSTVTGENNSTTSVKTQTPLYITLARLPGRLGNHMFQYASTLGITRAQDRQIVKTVGFQLNKIFELKHQLLSYKDYKSNISKWKLIKEARFACFQPSLMTLPPVNVNLFGYVQSYKYFDFIENDIRREFTFSRSIAKKADAILRNISAAYEGYVLVGIHVRRGDFLNVQFRGYTVAHASYFHKAIDWMKTAVFENKTLFVIISQDQRWCQKMFRGQNVKILPDAEAEVHLAVLSRCSHVIISGGTFGWWAGWLAGGHVVYFNGYMNKHTTFSKYFCPEDYYPSHWVGIGN